MQLAGRLGVFLSLLLCASAASAAAVVVDGHAHTLTFQAEREARAMRARPSSSDAERMAVLRNIEHIESLLLRVESGRATLSPAARMRLLSALDQLQSVAQSTEPKSKAITANGTLTGTVTDAGTSAPLAGVNVQAFEFSTQTLPSGAGVIAQMATNASGVYTLTLPPGKYHIRTSNAGNQSYINHVYGFGQCVNGVYCPRYVGTIATVTSAGTTSGIDLALAKGAQIQGHTQRASDSAVVAGTQVHAVRADGFSFVFGSIDGSGNYTLRGLAPGQWRVVAVPPSTSALIGQLYRSGGNLPCAQDCDTVQGGTYITVSGSGTTTGIDFSMPATSTLSGTVTELGTGTPLANATVQLVSEDGYTNITADAAPGAPFGESTDASGNYTFSQIRAGNYRVLVSRSITDPVTFFPSATHISRVYPSTDCFSCDVLALGSTVTVGAGAAVTGINVALDPGAVVSGTVLRASDSAPVVGANVNVVHASGVGGAATQTDASGNFTVRGVRFGVSYVAADARAQQLIQTWLGDIPCQNFDCVNVGVPITASATAVTGLIIRTPQAGSIQGTITDATTGAIAPSNRTRIELFDAATGKLIDQSLQRNQGGVVNYTVAGVPPGAYHAIAASSSVVGWIDSAFGTGLPCPRGGCDLSVLPTIYVTAGLTTSPVNFTVPRGPVVRGQLTDAASGQPIYAPGYDATYSSTVAIYNNTENYAGFGQVDGGGGYMSRTGFAPGAYFASTFLLRNNTPIGAGYIDEIFNNLACPYGSCGFTSGTPISIAGSDIVGIDYALSKGGTIAGSVTKLVGGGPLPGAVTLRAYNAAGRVVALTRSDILGNYRLAGLPTGSYYVTTENQLGYQDKLYNAMSCEPFCNPVTGNAVTVTAPATTSGINFSLDQSASVSGTVSGSHSANVTVEIYGAIGNFLRSTTTNAGGSYSFADLAGGRYYVRTRNAFGDADALYNAQPCVGTACQVRRGTPIDVLSGASATGINLVLSAPGVISGQVTDQSTSNAKSGVMLELYDARGALAASTNSSSTGNYTFAALATGNYYAVTRGTPGYIDESFNNVPCPAACDGTNGTPIAVTAGSTSTANFALSQGAQISGNLQNGAAAPVVGAVVQVYNASGVPVAQIATNASGNYQVDTLPDGNFFVRTQNILGFIDELFNNRPCSGYCDVIHGDAVTITGGASVGSINFVLAGGGSISGQVTSSAGGAGIALAAVQAFDISGIPAGSAQTDASGNYTISGLRNGSYRLRTVNTSGFVNEVYNAHGCSPAPCPLSSGNTVAVAGAVSGINFALDSGGTISGTATDQFNNPLPTGTATLFANTGVEIATNPVEAGVWEFNGLANGTYYVLIENDVGLIDQLYNAVPCPAGACNITAVGTPIVLTGSSAPLGIKALTSTAAIDLKLATGQTISGSVRDAGTSAPLANSTVYFFNSSGVVVGDGTTDALGDFTSSGGFAPGTYYAATANGIARGVGNGYINALYSGSNCLLACNVAGGTAISVSGSPVTGVNFSLVKGIGFGGRVADGGNNPLALVAVQVVDGAGRVAGTFATDSLGRYSADGIPAGTYYARTVNVLGLQDVLYGGAPCTGNCNVLTSNPIATAAMSQPQNIDFVLLPVDALFKDGFE